MHENLKSVKPNVGLFSRLFIACQTGNRDLKTLFEYENQIAPPSLSENRMVTSRLARKSSAILTCLLKDDHE